MSLIRFNNKTMNPGVFNFLSDVIGEESLNFNDHSQRKMIPSVNVHETDKAFELEMAVPGFDKKDISVEVEKDILTISSSKEVAKTENKKNIKRIEFEYGQFERSFSIPEDADTGNIKARSENGVLYIELPKKEEKVNVKKMVKVA